METMSICLYSWYVISTEWTIFCLWFLLWHPLIQSVIMLTIDGWQRVHREHLGKLIAVHVITKVVNHLAVKKKSSFQYLTPGNNIWVFLWYHYHEEKYGFSIKEGRYSAVPFMGSIVGV